MGSLLYCSGHVACTYAHTADPDSDATADPDPDSDATTADPDSDATPMKLSVVINAKDEGGRVKSTCNEFLKAGADDIVVCADGVTDGSCDRLPDKVKVVKHQESLGCGKAKFAATLHTSGDVIMWVDAHQNVLTGDLREFAARVLQSGSVVSPALQNIFYDDAWNPHPMEGSGRLFFPNDASLLPNCTQQYTFSNQSNRAVGVGVTMTRQTYQAIGGWNRYRGRHGSQERGMALRAFMASVPVEVDQSLVLGHEFFGETHPSRNKNTGQFRFNNLVPAACNVWHAFMTVCSPPTFEQTIKPWLLASGLGKGSSAQNFKEATEDRDYFLRHCKRRPDQELVELVTSLVADNFPPNDPGTAALEPMALSFIRATAKGRCLECGTGSTGGTRAILTGAQHVVSVDHLSQFTQQAQSSLQDSRVEFIHCPRSATGFYDLRQISGLFDFILLDGPPGTAARSQGIQELMPLLAPGGVLLVDDAKRDQSNITKAATEMPLKVEMLPTRRGLAKITRP